MRSSSFWFGLALLAGALGNPLWALPNKANNIALPDVSQTVDLRVAYVENPRFAALPKAHLDAVMAQAAIAVRQHFGLDVRFAALQTLPISTVFSRISERSAAKAEKARIDPTADARLREKLASSLLKDMRQEGSLAAQKRFALPHLLHPPAGSSDLAFARALVATQHDQLSAWRDTPAKDGQPTIGSDRYNEYTYWLALGDTDLPFEVILTNQLIASAEWEDNSVHSALRGGVSNGITSQSRQARFQLYSVVSSFAFVDGSAQTRRLRAESANAPSSPLDAPRAMGLLLAHELGHQLLHLGHPFGNLHCVMTPPVRLEFQRWEDALDAARCPLGSAPAIRPGFVKFVRPEVLFK